MVGEVQAGYLDEEDFLVVVREEEVVDAIKDQAVGQVEDKVSYIEGVCQYK